MKMEIIKIKLFVTVLTFYLSCSPKPVWLLLVVWSSVQSTPACQMNLAPMMLPLNSEYSPANLNSPFMQMIHDQSSFGGIPSPASMQFPGGFNELMDFNTLRPFGSPSLGCPPFYGCTWGPCGPIGYGNRSPILLGFNLAQGNASFLQRVSGGGEKEQNNKSTQCTPKCTTTKKPRRATRKKIRIVEN